ncbi:MAG: fumarylacetoacetate hydrolase family protein [Burkholderiales bacterium]
MKIGRVRTPEGGERLGAIVTSDGRERVLDLGAAAKAKHGASPFPTTMAAFIAAGSHGLALGYELLEWAPRQGTGAWFADEAMTDWLTPVAARNVLCAGRNFGRHKDESLGFWSKQGATGIHFEFPCGFIQLAHTLVPQRAIVKRPPDVTEFDYEVEVAAIIGKPVERVSEADALDCLFGYTVFNDLSAREWQRKEMRNQMIMLGKNFPGFGPIGPYILTADEVPDPAKLVVELKVNGRSLQKESCADMIFGFPKLIAFWSAMGLGPGDIIASGTPEGVAMHRKPDPFEFYLKPGDIVHAIVDRIGTLETRIA